MIVEMLTCMICQANYTQVHTVLAYGARECRSAQHDICAERWQLELFMIIIGSSYEVLWL
jgi:hypothetical protein